jgi:hypothetical protein
VKSTAHNANSASSPKTGFFAMPRGLFHARGSGVLSVALLLGVLGSLVFAGVPAQAAVAHRYLSQLTGAPGGSFGANVCGVVVDPVTQDVYVADPGNDVIDIFEPSGAGVYAYKSQISGTSIPTGPFGVREFPEEPCSVAVSGVTGEVYVTGKAPEDLSIPNGPNEWVYVFNAMGDWIKTIDGSGTPKEGGTPQGGFGSGGYVANVAVNQSSGEVYVASSFYGLVDRFNSANEYQSQFTVPEPEWLATDSSGDTYDYSRGGVYEFNSSGSQIAQITVPQSGENSIAVDSAGDVYVTHEGNLRRTSKEDGLALPVEEFGPAGELEGETRGTPGGPFSKPQSAVVNSSGDLFVVDRSAYGDFGSPGIVDIFGAGFVVPGTTAQAPSSTSPTTAAVGGSVNPAGVQVTSCEFEYGTSTSYGQSVPCEQTVGNGTSPVAVTATLSPLQPDTTYHYRLNAVNANGDAYEAGTNDEVFTTSGVPKIDSESAEVKSSEKAGQTHATLTAQITPNGRETTYHFEYGETESYGSSVPIPDGVIAAGFAEEGVSVELSGLKVGTTYHYRIVASNEYGTIPGPDHEFTTVAATLIEGSSVSKVAATSVTFDAQVDPLGTDTRAYFRYGTVSCASSPASCTDTPEVDIGSAEGYQALGAHVQNLMSSTTYYYRVIATNALGTVEGEYNEKGEEIVHTFTTQLPGSTLALPDDRQWEMVSPPDKHGAVIAPIGEEGVIEAAASGGAFTYVTGSPIESNPRGYANFGQVLSTRGNTAWSSQDVALRHDTGTGVPFGTGLEYRAFSPDLSLALVQPAGEFTPLTGEEASPEASEDTPYLRADFTCQVTPATCYTPLVTEANVPPGTKFGETGHSTSTEEGAVRFVGATPDLSHVLLTSVIVSSHAKATALIEGAPENSLYEWANRRLQLVNILPASEGGVPVADVRLGADFGLSTYGAETRNAISEDGSRVFWSTGGDVGALYMRDMATGETEETVRLDLPEAQCLKEVTCGSEPAHPEFDMASSDGSTVFFTDTQHLTASSRGRLASGEGNEPDLYACEMVEVQEAGQQKLKCDLSDLTTDSNPDGERADVQGAVLAASEDGAYVYFVANGVLGDGAEAGATQGDCGDAQVPGEAQMCDLYVEHYDGSAWEAPRFIAALSGADSPDWKYSRLDQHTSRSSPDGRYLAFMSQRPLRGYDNTDVDETGGKHADEELFLYDVLTGKLVCASCNPTGARPVGQEYGGAIHETMPLVGGSRVWSESTWLSADVPGWTTFEDGQGIHQPRYLSDSGRLFFNSREALVPQDVNGTWDVYEYESPGVGTCTTSSTTFGARSGGCVSLISSGESSEETAFLDASETGGDVFFLTASQLVSQDFDHSLDVYDARECTSSSACFPTPAEAPPACTTEASCKRAPEPQPLIYGAPASATFSGPGNIAPLPAAPVTKPKARPLTRAQKLVNALKACRKRLKQKRAVCEGRARKDYGPAHKAKKAGNGGRAGR